MQAQKWWRDCKLLLWILGTFGPLAATFPRHYSPPHSTRKRPANDLQTTNPDKNNHPMSTSALISAAPVSVLLPVTLTAAALCAFLQVALTALVTARRLKAGISFLDGGDTTLTRRMRAHGNLTETAPVALLMMGFLELTAAPRDLLLALAGLLVAGRVLHAAGVLRRGDCAARRLGMVATQFALSGLGVACLWLGARGW